MNRKQKAYISLMFASMAGVASLREFDYEEIMIVKVLDYWLETWLEYKDVEGF